MFDSAIFTFILYHNSSWKERSPISVISYQLGAIAKLTKKSSVYPWHNQCLANGERSPLNQESGGKSWRSPISL
ncbi:MAG: hypothetical protein AAGJ08_09970 [Cyanobacteria bacterium P01_H01_bin.35]